MMDQAERRPLDDHLAMTRICALMVAEMVREAEPGERGSLSVETWAEIEEECDAWEVPAPVRRVMLRMYAEALREAARS